MRFTFDWNAWTHHECVSLLIGMFVIPERILGGGGSGKLRPRTTWMGPSYFVCVVASDWMASGSFYAAGRRTRDTPCMMHLSLGRFASECSFVAMPLRRVWCAVVTTSVEHVVCVCDFGVGFVSPEREKSDVVRRREQLRRAKFSCWRVVGAVEVAVCCC